MRTLAPLLALALLSPAAPRPAPPPAQTRTQVDTVVAAPPARAYALVQRVFAAERIPLAQGSAEGGVLVSAPVERKTWGIVRSSYTYRATLVAVDSAATRVSLSAAVQERRNGLTQDPEEPVTSRSFGTRGSVWRQLERMAAAVASPER